MGIYRLGEELLAFQKDSFPWSLLVYVHCPNLKSVFVISCLFSFQLGLKPKFHQLDVTDQKSLETFHDFIKNKHGGIDVLVNNAAIAYRVSDYGWDELVQLLYEMYV